MLEATAAAAAACSFKIKSAKYLGLQASCASPDAAGKQQQAAWNFCTRFFAQGNFVKMERPQ